MALGRWQGIVGPSWCPDRGFEFGGVTQSTHLQNGNEGPAARVVLINQDAVGKGSGAEALSAFLFFAAPLPGAGSIPLSLSDMEG